MLGQRRKFSEVTKTYHTIDPILKNRTIDFPTNVWMPRIISFEIFSFIFNHLFYKHPNQPAWWRGGKELRTGNSDWHTSDGLFINVKNTHSDAHKLDDLDLRPSVTTLLCVLSASSDSGNLGGGEGLHGHCIKVGFCSDLNLVTALIDMYAKTGNIELGRMIFDEVAEKDVVLWNCVIDNYARNGMVEKALALLHDMKLQQVKPNSSTLAGLLSACAASGAINLGRNIDNYVEQEELVLDVVLGTALVDMYAKCGFLEKAIEIFDRMESKDVKSWTAMISGYGVHGQATNAIKLFYRMEQEGFRPNAVTFLAMLSAFSHGGLVTEGMRCFERMVCEYGLSPQVEHYGCMIDLFGRAGLLEEAHKLINSLPIKGDTTAWRSLLAACRTYGNVKLGERVKRVLEKVYDEHPTDSILLSSTYAIAGRLPEERKFEELKEENIIEKVKCKSLETEEEKVKKEAGCSMIEVDSQWWTVDT
ncbi:hypothetical protein CJ030_MR7G000820 [Morella rubra]|uniref:Pentatricopeptide repeat-containing protein n=1 Tax=Morella rubra TaxID=262757 RepID=A0A6A1V782_9ROSI|nr:hypothetical protein CJ030_MR7G000820 [Morella rubra]